MKTITLAQLASDMDKFLEDAARSADVLVVPRGAEDNAVVIMSMKEYNSLQETAHLLSTAANRARLTESLSQAEKGKTRSMPLSKLDEKPQQ